MLLLRSVSRLQHFSKQLEPHTRISRLRYNYNENKNTETGRSA